MTPLALAGLLADERRLRALSAVALGARPAAEVAAATSLSSRETAAAGCTGSRRREWSWRTRSCGSRSRCCAAWLRPDRRRTTGRRRTCERIYRLGPDAPPPSNGERLVRGTGLT